MFKTIFTLSILTALIPSVLNAQSIHVVTEEWAPYNYTEDKNIKGMSTEIVEATLKEAGLTYDINIHPWARSLKIAQQNPNTLIYTISRTASREKMFQWVGPIAPRTQYLFKLKKRKDIKITSLKDAKKYIIGVVRGDAMETYLNANGFEVWKNYQTVTYPKQNIKKLLSNRIDLITGNEISLIFAMQKLNLNYADLEKIIIITDEGSYYMAFNKKTPKSIVIKTKVAFEKIKDSGKINQIRKKYIK